MKFAPNTQMPEAEAYAIYLKGRWFDLGDLTSKDASGDLENYLEETVNAMMEESLFAGMMEETEQSTD